MAKRPSKSPDTPEIGDSVILTGEVVYIDDDGIPRIQIEGAGYPVRVSPSGFVQLIKGPKAPKWDKPD